MCGSLRSGRETVKFEVMSVLIVAAMGKELSLILHLMEKNGPIEKENVDGTDVYAGVLAGRQVYAAQCGIGKVNSALCTDALIRRFNPELVINSGVAGGIDASMHIGDILVADSVAYHDVWCGPGTVPGAADGFDAVLLPSESHVALMRRVHPEGVDRYRYGLICSGDKFISTPEEVDTIKKIHPAGLGCDMESASIAQVCVRRGVPFMIIRVMSDMPGGGENLSEYQNFWEDAPKATFSAVESLMENLK